MRGAKRGIEAALGEGDWAGALERIAARCAGRPTRLRALPAGGEGAHRGAGPYPLRSMSFDERSDEVRVGLGAPAADGPALRCFIAAPSRVTVAEDEDNGRISVLVSGVGPTRTLIEVSARRRGGGAFVQGEPPVVFHRPALRKGARDGGSRAI